MASHVATAYEANPLWLKEIPMWPKLFGKNVIYIDMKYTFPRKNFFGMAKAIQVLEPSQNIIIDWSSTSYPSIVDSS